MTSETEPKLVAPEIIERYAAWSSSHGDEAFGYVLSVVKFQCSHKVAGDLFDLHLMYEHANDLQKKFERVQDWAYGVATAYAIDKKIRYGFGWGRQAAKDGAFLAMWADEKSAAGMLTIPVRAIQFGICEDNYRGVRRHVRNCAVKLIDEFNDKLLTVIKSGL